MIRGMDKKVQWALVVLLAVALAYVAWLTRYEYPERFGGTRRVDRWTGAYQRLECVRWTGASPDKSDPYREIFDADETGCLRYGWKPR